ncbi:type II CRISPR-associated endonuclease Cas1 [Parvimonas micra]|uniref:type II CRISPR-associated endonuclease Cas1 n=1 Tax=Parvimonas micra TaxID=33033 RepID=UPI002004F9F3|nr:type II CRISPR-associated endonuclease Cas1 [Parvimonas micra]MCK6130772.1 type II CRISPR-associated endonuclease Cas1 [Parvimonas micra]MCK6136417.1 type II CRISPR-associated endonuclease Cas1 [Parvimonas micra]MCK6137888.1 type II CRISPR-associated endonuclease Cas1 [Parvimonas micra]MCK6154416.1 type II CRISPR-associated endonuclease Cas1 [Parvimonas micra]
MAGWRTIVITERCKLDLRYNNMNIRKNESLKQVNISEIGVLIIESTSVSITSALLSELMKNKIKVIFCDETHNPESELIPYYGGYDSSERIKSQIFWDDEIKESLWTLIVSEKIRKQMEVLKYFNLKEYKLLENYMFQVEHFDVTNREGHAAKVYFNSLFGVNFNRDDKENVINMALDYGYSILLSLFNREVVSNGYITNIGLFHRNKFNPFNLSCDLMEPFRPLVDKLVVEIGIDNFGTDEKRNLQQLLSTQLYIKNKEYYLQDVIKIYTKSLLDGLDERDLTNLWFYENEL